MMRVFRDIESLPEFKNAVITIGSFDGVHLGHQQLIEQMRELARNCAGETLVITFTPHPRQVLNPADSNFRLLSTDAEKIQILQKFGLDNLVIVPFTEGFSNLSAEQYVTQFLLKRFNPRYIVIGYDHHFGSNREGNISFLKKYAAPGILDIVEIAAHQIEEIAVSSSKIRKALENSDLHTANRLLGHPYLLSGAVVEGDKIGRKIGFPTANIAIKDTHKLIPPNGIYAAIATLADGSTKRAMLYIGDRPSILENGARVIEVNILDFDGSIYGQELQVEIFDFIRNDQKLQDLEALKKQIEADKIQITARLDTLLPMQSTATETSVTSANKLDIAIVILNYNTQKHLETYLPSVVKYSPEARIIVADNGSPDDSIAFLKRHYPQVEVLDLKVNYGFAEGYNQALKHIKADYYILLNSDVEVTPNWIAPIIGAMEKDPSIAVAQPKIRAWSNKKYFEYAGASGGWIDLLGYPFCRGRIFGNIEEDAGQYDIAQACFWASGAAFFVRAPLYQKFGGFDGDYFAHNEEIDLCWRFQRAGYSIWCFPQSTVYHLGGGTLEYENPRKVFLNFRNSLYSIIKNEKLSKLLWLIPLRFVLDGVAGARFAAKGQFRAIGAIIRAHFSLYGNLRNTIAKRRETALKINALKIKPMRIAGIYPKSVIVAYYLSGKKRYKQLLLSIERQN